MPPPTGTIRQRAHAHRLAAANDWAVIALDAQWLAKHRERRRRTRPPRGRLGRRR